MKVDQAIGINLKEVNNMSLTKSELGILEDAEFLLTKARLISKVQTLLAEVRTEINKHIKIAAFSFPSDIYPKTGKISRGENYKNLPYLVLDHPSLFRSEDIFAFRTMFWWGNFFSATLHLEGQSLEKYRGAIANNIKRLDGEQIYVAIGESPWHYDYEENNYIPLNEVDKQFIEDCKFLKLSKKTELKNWENIPRFSADFLELSTSILI
ncbi:MAG: hypothetical protein ACI9GZ_001196 [Bacteroidia bacterium]